MLYWPLFRSYSSGGCVYSTQFDPSRLTLLSNFEFHSRCSTGLSLEATVVAGVAISGHAHLTKFYPFPLTLLCNFEFHSRCSTGLCLETTVVVGVAMAGHTHSTKFSPSRPIRVDSPEQL